MKHQSIIEIFLQTLNHYVLRFQSAIDPLHQRLQKKGSLSNERKSSFLAQGFRGLLPEPNSKFVGFVNVIKILAYASSQVVF